MNNISKLKEFTVEELQEQLKDKKIDKEFLIEYIVKRDKVYNQLVDEVNKLEANRNKAIEFISSRFNEDNHLSCGAVARALSILEGDRNE